jgi:hypothetical protein
MSMGARDVRWLRQLLESMRAPPLGPTPLFVDNMGAVYLSRNPVVSDKARHIGVAMHHVREQQTQEQTLVVIHKMAEGQIADYLTKPVVGTK